MQHSSQLISLSPLPVSPTPCPLFVLLKKGRQPNGAMFSSSKGTIVGRGGGNRMPCHFVGHLVSVMGGHYF